MVITGNIYIHNLFHSSWSLVWWHFRRGTLGPLALQYTELFLMPQHRTMLKIISKIIITATTMAAMPIR